MQNETQDEIRNAPQNETQSAPNPASRRDTRRALKKRAKTRLKRCYGLFMVLCLFLAVLGLDYQDDLTLLKSETSLFTSTKIVSSEGAEALEGVLESAAHSIPFVSNFTDVDTKVLRYLSDLSPFTRVFVNLLYGEDDVAKVDSDVSYAVNAVSETDVGPLAIGYRKGILAGLVNNVASGRILTTLFNAVQTASGSKKAATVVLIIVTLLVYAFVWGFIFNLFWVTVKRFFLESRLYDHVPMKRFLFLTETRQALKAVWTTIVCDIYSTLWSLTIVGGAIKYYSYYMVPWIVAENPSLSPKEAITLSRKMMDGHKWERFVLDLSFLPWKLLNLVTFGLLGIFFLNPYWEATDAEYYAYIRGLAKEKGIENADKLNDVYLYEYASKEALEAAYADVLDYIPDATYQPRTGVLGFLENFFGITLVNDEKAKEYERIHGEAYNMKGFKAILACQMYPRRLFTIPGEDIRFRKLSPLNFDRCYSIISLIFIFFTVCFVGWLWEGSLHVIKDGYFPNRGVLHGPWLPIYGGGSVMILILLKKLRRHPVIEFCSAVVLCGIVEYCTSLYLQITQNGAKWWDYHGYFLNINGRICAEGLLVFGIGGIAIVYFLAPLLDNMIRHIPFKIAVPIAAVLLSCFAVDMVYSKKHPNQGKGVTDYKSTAAHEERGTVLMAAEPEPYEITLPGDDGPVADSILYELVG